MSNPDGPDHEIATHYAMMHVQWSHSFPSAADWSTPANAPTILTDSLNGPALDRASYFVACQPFVDELNLHVPVEPELLGPYPTNPFPSEEWPARLVESGFGDLDRKVVFDSGLQIASRALVRAYLSLIDEPMIDSQLSGAPSDAILLDPLAGMILWREGTRVRNQHLAWGSTLRWLKQSPDNVKSWHSRGLQNELLGEGAIIGRELFSNTLHNQAQRAYERFEVAETIARHPEELAQRIDQLQNAVARHPGDFELWYRGQNSDFLIPDRSSLVRARVTPYSNVRDSSLVPSLYRKADQHFTDPMKYEAFARGLEEWRSAAGMLSAPPRIETRPFPEFSSPPASVPPGTIQRSTVSIDQSSDPNSLFGIGMHSVRELVAPDGRIVDRTFVDLEPERYAIRRGLLLQHYGCPTPWLDITKDPEVALWFALHELSPFDVNGATVSRTRSWPQKQSAWPTIYVFALSRKRGHAFLDTEQFVPPSIALRPSRQRCGLLGGPANLVRNYGARLIALKIRVGPGFASTDVLPAEYYFPGEREDPMLAGLVRGMISNKAVSPLFPPWFLL